MWRLLILTVALSAPGCDDDDESGTQSQPADAGAVDARGLDGPAPDAAGLTPDARQDDPDAAIGDPDSAIGDPDAAVGPDAAPADDCVGVCEYLEGCGGCFQDDEGVCLDIPGCEIGRASCRERV